jgi:bifunctional non-homologous end joining protein LigD
MAPPRRSEKNRLPAGRPKRRLAEASGPTGREKGAPTKKADPLPRHLHPELATLVDAPFDDERWLFEIKWDGFRAITSVDRKGGVAMESRNGKDFLARFPALSSIGASFVSPPVVVDGEIVAFDEEGKSSFQRLQNGANAKLTYVVFDVLYAGGRDLRAEPLEARKKILAKILHRSAKDVILSTHVVGTGKALFAEARARGLEGVVAKRRDAPYVEKRTRDWLKIKAQLEQECVIVGYTEPGGSRAGFGSLILGLYDHGRLVPCGNVGTGFDAKSLSSLRKKLASLETVVSPLAGSPPPRTRARAHWVSPTLVAQVRFTEWTHDGAMRHPAFLGIRDDKRPRDCHRERTRPASEVA